MKKISLSSVLKKIEKHNWWSEEAPGVYAFIGWPLRAFIEQAKYFHSKYLSISIFIYQNDFFYEETPADEKLKVYNYIYKKAEKKMTYLVGLRRDSKKSAQKFLKAGKELEKDISRATNNQLWKLYKKFSEAYLDYIRYGAAIECVDVFSSEKLPELVKNEIPNLSENEALEIAITLSAPLNLTFFEKEELMLFQGAVLGYEVLSSNPKINFNQACLKLPKLKKILEKLAKNYFWIGNNYQKARVLDEKYFLDRIKELARKKSKRELIQEVNNFKTKIVRLRKIKRKYLKKYKFSKDLLLHFSILEYMAEWIDERKKHMTMANHYHELFCQEASKRFNLDAWLVKYYTPEEFEILLLHSKKVLDKIIKNRRKFSAQIVTKGKAWHFQEKIFYGRETKAIYNALFRMSGKEEIKGQVASAPVVKMEGRVQVILDVSRQKFKAGNILVTTMTRPEFIPLLRRAKAIITDEGGLTCHAAIISRELGIPCIIGTRVATKVLKNGDKVEVDANNGIIRLVNN